MNATQASILNAVKGGKIIRVSNRNDVNAGKAHHATVKVLVNMGAVVVNADKTLAIKGKAERNPARPSAKLEALREALAFAEERADTCGRMVKSGTCTVARWMQWVRKVEALRAELRSAA